MSVCEQSPVATPGEDAIPGPDDRLSLDSRRDAIAGRLPLKRLTA